MRWLALLLVTVAIVVQIGYEFLSYTADGRTIAWWFGAVMTLGFAGLLVSAGRWLTGFLRLAVGLVFGISVGDRLGLFEKLGASGAPLAKFAHEIGFAP